MASKTLKLKGEFDASSILASLKRVRNEAEKNNVSSKLLGSFDKDLAKIESLTTQYLAQIKKGFETNADTKAFMKTLTELEKQYSVIAVRAEQFGDTENYSKQTAEIKQMIAQLKIYEKEQQRLTNSAKTFIETKQKELKLTNQEVKGLKDAVTDAERYREKIEEITEAKKAAAKVKLNKIAIDTSYGQDEYNSISKQQKNFQFSIADKKVADSSRKTAVKGYGDNAQIDVIKANDAAMKEYNRILDETMRNGKEAADAMEAFTEIMRHYKLEVENADEMQKQFAADMDSIRGVAIANRGNLDSKTKGAITRNINAGNNADNLQSVLNSGDVVAAQQRTQALINETERLTQAERDREQAIKDSAKASSEELNSAAGQMRGLIEAEKEETIVKQNEISAQDALNETFDNLQYTIKQVLSIGSVYREIRQIIHQTYSDVKELDKAFGEIAMVTDYSVQDLWAQYGNYAKMANELGQSTTSVIQASGLFYQQGLDTAEALSLTEDTMKLATLAGLDFSDATSQMTAALRAFHMEMDEGSHITDVYAELAAHAAADVQGIATAMSKTASIANSAGMSFENTATFLTTMIEATQEAPKIIIVCFNCLVKF